MNLLRPPRELADLQEYWSAAWPTAIAHWSRFVQLHEPQWCFTPQEEHHEHLSGSFAMIRLVDHSVVISLRQIHELKLEQFAAEVLAHEIGHHVYCPADLTDNARLLARIRRGLPTLEAHGPMVANLYADLLINDRLQRSASLDMAGIYRTLGIQSEGALWRLYMRIYEQLWSLPRGTLIAGESDARVNTDAQLGARLIRSYSVDWLQGAGRFAALCLPYLLKDAAREAASKRIVVWCDLKGAGRGGLPDGLIEIDDDETSGAIHPAEDPELSGLDGEHAAQGRTPSALSGQKTVENYRQPFEYAEVLKASGVELDEREIAAHYYQERALPHLISFPVKRTPQASDPLIEGLETWEVGDSLDQIDWTGTLLSSPLVVPGVTTRQRVYGTSPGSDPETIPFDLYLGIDCSGSMGDPAHHMSYPVLAGVIMALSALRAGSRVKVVLSGEPGSTVSTDGFIRDRTVILKTLVGYLGTGYAFGIHRLAETFEPSSRPKRPVHILIVSDNDMFSMLAERGNGRLGWDVAREALPIGGGGGTMVLQLGARMREYGDYPAHLERLQQTGWEVALVDSMEELVAFAANFSRRNFEQKPR